MKEISTDLTLLKSKHLQNIIMNNHNILQEHTEHDAEDGKIGEAVSVNAAGYCQLYLREPI